MKLLIAITLLLTSLIFGMMYFKQAKNIYFSTKKTRVYSIVSMLMLMAGLYIFEIHLIIIGSLAAIYLILVNIIEASKVENLHMLESFDGIVRDYEIPIKWLNNAKIRSNIIFNPEDKESYKVDYINKTIRTYSNKYIYYAIFKNGKKKLIQKNTLMHKKIHEKYNQ